MTGYRFFFVNDLADSTGHEVHACQREIVVGEADLNQAMERAKSEFQRLEGVADWRFRARTIDFEPLSGTKRRPERGCRARVELPKGENK